MAYLEGANQLLRALYDQSAKDETAYFSYDKLVELGEVAADFQWVRRFVKDMADQGYIDAVETIGPAENIGMRILPPGQTFVESRLEANPAWGLKPRKSDKIDGAFGSGFGSGAFGAGPFGGPSPAPAISETEINVSSGPSAGGAISVASSYHSVEDSSPSLSASIQPVNPVAWTGVQSRVERIAIVRNLFPLARDAIEQMMQDLSRQGANGGPLLDEAQDAIKHLRNLHTALGEFLSAVDQGSFDDQLGEDLASKVIRFGKRAVESVRDDPGRYAVATLIFGVLTIFGQPGIGSFAASAAPRIEKPKKP